jgi:hypothetical protein
MKVSIRITTVGSSLGFHITPEIAKQLEIGHGDLVLFSTTKIIRDGVMQPLEVHLRAKTIIFGHDRQGIIIDKKLAAALKMEKGNVLTGTIEKDDGK